MAGKFVSATVPAFSDMVDLLVGVAPALIAVILTLAVYLFSRLGDS